MVEDDRVSACHLNELIQNKSVRVLLNRHSDLTLLFLHKHDLDLIDKFRVYFLISYNINSKVNDNTLTFTELDAIDVSRYIESKQSVDLRNRYNKTCEIPTFSYNLKCPEAVPPCKMRESDVGYDLTLVKEIKYIAPDVILYDTGVVVQPPYGYYFEVVPRSSLSKSGFTLANSIGIIDPGYRGTIKVALKKNSTSTPDLDLPFRAVQLILRKQTLSRSVYSKSDLSESSRSTGGFGSTG
jgi:deoxyuridine 5'-triphosphate nucleotidohydrolase